MAYHRTPSVATAPVRHSHALFFPAAVIKNVMRSMFPEDRGSLTQVPPSGPAPVLMRAADWLKVTPDWERLAAHIEATPEAKSKLGWVREMYAFSIATALQVRTPRQGLPYIFAMLLESLYISVLPVQLTPPSCEWSSPSSAQLHKCQALHPSRGLPSVWSCAALHSIATTAPP